MVGQAELLSAAFSLPALLLYCRLADGPRGGGDGGRGGDGTASRRSSDGMGISSNGSGGSSGGSGRSGGPGGKHVGDAPTSTRWLRAHAAPGPALSVILLLTWLAALSKEIGITAVGSMAAYDLLLGRPGRAQLPRLAVLAAAGVAYVRLRGWVAGDHLVRIYRKVGPRGDGEGWGEEVPRRWAGAARGQALPQDGARPQG